MFCNTKWYLFFLEYFNIFSDFIFQDCLCWFLHYESHSVGERLLSCNPFWHFGCYPCYVVWNFCPTNICWCLFWLQREGRALWIQIWSTPVICNWAIESLSRSSRQDLVGLKHLWSHACKMVFYCLDVETERIFVMSHQTGFFCPFTRIRF